MNAKQKALGLLLLLCLVGALVSGGWWSYLGIPIAALFVEEAFGSQLMNWYPKSAWATRLVRTPRDRSPGDKS